MNHDPQARRQLRRIDRWRVIWAASRNHLASRSILADAQLAFMRRVQAAAQRNLSRRWPRVGLAGISGRWPMAWTRKKAVAGVSGLLAVGLVAGLIAAFATYPPAPNRRPNRRRPAIPLSFSRRSPASAFQRRGRCWS